LAVSLLDDETAAAIASIEVREEFEGHGEGRRLVGYTKKIRFWDKTAAISMAMKHLGLFERHNVQQQPNVNLQINIVGSPLIEDGVFNKTITD
jgi:phage terminase small subunit